MPRVSAALFIAALAIATAVSLSLVAQDQPDRGFQTEVNYVRVDMYPTANGRPVTDLVQAEVEVLEDGAPQELEHFEHVSISGPRPQTRREPSTLAEMRRAAQDPRARVFVLFLDPRHVDLDGSFKVRRPLVDTLNALIGGDDLIAIMTPEMSARDLTFTRRLGSIEEMLTPHWGQEGWIGTRDLKEIQYEACYDLPVSIVEGPEIARAMIARHREVLVLDALDSLIDYLGGLREERKAVITISDGWPLYGPDERLTKVLEVPCSQPPCQVEVPIPKIGFDPRTGRPTLDAPSSSTSITSDGGTIDRAKCETDRVTLAAIENRDRFVRLMQRANRANVSFYPVGPGGFSAAYRPLNVRRRSLEMMAEITDGHAIIQPASMERGLRRIVDDLSSYYLLAYHSNAKPDGRFHRITVRVKRPGVQVRARAGYLAASPAEAAARVSSSVSSPDAAEAQLVSRALNPLAALSRERPVRVQAAVAWAPSGTAVVRAVTELSRDTARGDDWGKGAQVNAMLVDAAGDTVATGRASIAPGTFVAELTLTPRAPLVPGDYELQIRATGADVVSPGIEELRLRVPAAPAGVGVLFMRRGPSTGNREVPTADARFRRAERLILEAPASPAGAVSARLLDRVGNALPIPVTTAIREHADGSRWRRIELILAPLAQGDYIIESTDGPERMLTGFRMVP